ncbi:hypothetical protein [Streptomyces sp. NPDC096324]|uniref:hypothetical protein n=1 Tax=Streptomyces sp. NPDC096324 TaxID=3366085 RepID=UPI00380AEE00
MHASAGALARTEARILSGTAGSAAEPAGMADSVWDRAAAAWDRSVPARSNARLHATAGLLRDLAVTGPDGLEEARRHRGDLVAAAETTGDIELAARIIGSYDVPAVWTRADDPDDAGELCRAAARAAARFGPGGPAALRARLLSVVAVESRGDAAATLRFPGRPTPAPPNRGGGAPNAPQRRPSGSPAAWATPRSSRSPSTAPSCGRSPTAGRPPPETSSAVS